MKKFARAATLIIASSFFVAGCISNSGRPKTSELTFIYVDCVKEANNGQGVNFKASFKPKDGLKFEDFVPEGNLTDAQTAQIRKCYNAKVAAASG